MIKIQIVSELHLETLPAYSDYDFPATATYLALLGDIGHVCDNAFPGWLEEIVARYRAVFLSSATMSRTTCDIRLPNVR